MEQANQERIARLIDRLNAGMITDEEKQELRNWFEAIDFPGIPMLDEKDEAFEEKVASSYAQVLARVTAAGKRKRVIRIIRRIAAAAVLLLGLGIVWDHYFYKNLNHSPSQIRNDVPPGSTKALLVLASGKSVQLNENIDSTFLQGNVQIQQQNGSLAYKDKGKDNETAYNTLITPNGGQYEVVLSDGTKVWLNAASSLKYPTQFTGKERLVELTGEAYFEVAAQAGRPFKVSVRGMEVKVLGTAFNVMAYQDEKSIKTTLFEGKVKILNGDKTGILQPGEEAIVDNAHENITVQKADVNEAVAWKNGFFLFDGADIETIMRQLARWYDVKVTYEGATPTDHFRGKAPRNTNISQVLKVLELSGVHFRIEGRNIIVLP